jgi:dTDP-4-amino-4,6-dideoxygalactose transaminase
VQAAIGIAQMRRLPGFLETRERNFDRLEAGLSQVEGLTVLESGHYGDARSSHYCLVAMLDESLAGAREEIIDSLKAAGIGTSVYYPLPLPLTTYYSERVETDYDFAISHRISTESIAFPVGPHVDDEGTDRIIESVERTLAEVPAPA